MPTKKPTGEHPDASDTEETEALGGRCPCRGLLEKEIDADDMALIALCTGVASLIISVFGAPGWRSALGLVCGALAVSCGWLAARNEGRHTKQAVAGLICGMIGLCFQLLR